MTLSSRHYLHINRDAERQRRAKSMVRARHALHRWAGRPLGQVVVLICAAATYFGVRHLTESNPSAAYEHAGWVRSFESTLHLNQESWLQRQVLPHEWIIDIADDVYIYGHWPFIIAALAWLLMRHREYFAIARNALLMSGAVALVVFALFPVAPPRLAQHHAIVDTVTLHTNAYRVVQPPAFTDAFAAMPSLHCGWDLLVAVTVAHATSRRWLRSVIMIVPMLMAASVLVTGNHYVVDIVVGDAIALGAWHLARRRLTRSRRTTAPASIDVLATEPIAA